MKTTIRLIGQRKGRTIMVYRVIIAPLVLAVFTLLQGMAELGIYVCFQHIVTPAPTSFLTTAYSNIWAGGWNVIASTSLIYFLYTANDKNLHLMRLWCLLLFASIFLVQCSSLVVCEVLEFHWYSTVTNNPNQNDTDRNLIHAYLSTVVCTVIGACSGLCGGVYIFLVFYYFAARLFKGDSIENRLPPIRSIETSTQTPISQGRRDQPLPSAPAALDRGDSTASKSWEFHGFRSSTPKKAHTDKIRVLRRNGRRGRFDVSSIKMGRGGALDISDEEFNRSVPLRVIATVHPQTFTIGQELESPTLEDNSSPSSELSNHYDRSRPGNEMRTFFDDTPVRNLANGIGSRHRPLVNAGNDSGLSSQHGPARTAWRLPQIPRPRMANPLNYSQASTQKFENSNTAVETDTRL